MVFKSTTYVPGDAAAGSRIRSFRPSRDQCLSELAEPCAETTWRAPGEFLRGGTNSSNPSPSCGESYKLDDGGRSRRPTKVSASHQGRADGHAAPRFPGHGPSIDALRRSALGVGGFHVAFDVIASGDEDIVTSERTQAIRDQTGAACVAWEGSGAARAALFNGIGSLEIRAVTDAADKEAPQRFDANLPIAMANLASLLGLWLE